MNNRAPSGKIYLPEIESHIEAFSINGPQWALEFVKGIYQYQALGNYEQGLEYLLAVIDKNPDNEGANQLIGNNYKRSLKIKQAYAYINKSITINPLNPINWFELSYCLALNGDYKNGLQAQYKALELGMDSTHFVWLKFWHLMTGISVDSVPENYRYHDDKTFLLAEAWGSSPRKMIEQLKMISFDSTPGLFKYTKTEYYREMAAAYHALYLDDSARYYARLCIQENANQIVKEWHLVYDSYALLGDIKKSQEIPKPAHVSNEDFQLYVWDLRYSMKRYIFSQKYAEATKLLLKLNKDFPEYGDYVFLAFYEFDRAKKEHPPFAEAVANLKMPEPLKK